MSDFNSSDIEIEPAPKPFANAGQQSIADMLEHATADRVLSKIFVKQLQDLRGDRKAQSDRARWAARFEAFYKDTLEMKVEQCPTSLHVISFLETIVSRVKPKAHDVPTFSWMKSSIYHLTKALIFRYPDFQLRAHDSARIKAAVNTLWRQGLLTKESAWDHQSVGVVIARKVVLGHKWMPIYDGALQHSKRPVVYAFLEKPLCDTWRSHSIV